MNPSTQDQSQPDLGIKTLVMFDTETTGLPSPGNKSRIIELCFVALLKYELLSNYNEIRWMNKLLLCFNPHKKIGPGSSEITGLHNDALEAYGPFKSQANLVSSFLISLPQPACLIAHNGIRANITEGSRLAEEDCSRKKSKEGSSIPSTAASTVFTCTKCDRACASRIGLISHMKACKGKVSSPEM